jgi:hypothetical protein
MSPEEQEKAWDELLTKARDVIDRAKVIEGQAEEVVQIAKIRKLGTIRLRNRYLLVRTPKYAIGNGDGSHLVLLDKFKYLTGNAEVGADVATIHFLVV